MHRIKETNKIRLFALTLLALALLAARSLCAATLTSDKADYPPGSIVTLTGSGFAPGEGVTLQVVHDDPLADNDNDTSTAHDPWQVVADADGAFVTTWLVPSDEDEAGASLEATAIGLTSALSAEALFTDGVVDLSFTQFANGKDGMAPVDWINGVLQGSKSKYYEGMSVPQRILMQGIQPVSGATNPNSHVLLLKVLATKAGVHAYDFLTSWEQAISAPPIVVSPTLGYLMTNLMPAQCLSGSGQSITDVCDALHSGGNLLRPEVTGDLGTVPGFSPATDNSQFRADAYVAALGGMTRRASIYGNSNIVSASFVFLNYEVGSGEYYADYAVTWDSPSTQLLIEIAGHLAQTTDGGEGLAYRFSGGSANINGGPYHFKLITLDGASLGSQDNQISGSTIQPSAPECAIAPGLTNVCPGQSVTFVGTILRGGQSPFIYTWISPENNYTNVITSSETNTSITVSAPGTYTLSIVDANGLPGRSPCMSVLTNSAATSASDLASLAKCPGETAEFFTEASGSPNAITGTFSFVWKKGGVTLSPGARISILNTETNSHLTISGLVGSDNGNYCVDVTGLCNTAEKCATLAIDATPPTLTCAPNKTVECGTSWSFDPPAATDASGTANVTLLGAVTNALCGTTFRAACAWMATDACLNTSTCTQIVTVVDTTGPSISCPANITLECTVLPTTDNTGTATATDCSGVKSITFADTLGTANCTGKRAITRTWTAEDNCGNKSTCAQLIDFKDTVAPVITCPANITLECTVAATPSNAGTATATDECSGIKSITFADTPGTANCTGKQSISRTWTAEDNCGNKSTCTQLIDFKDTVAPVITCPANITLECNLAATTDNTGTASATDACSGIKSITFTDTAGTANCTGKQSISRTWTAEDNCGNKSTCTQLIDFKDTVAPVITCPANITLECTVAATTNNTGVATATDECSGVKSISFADTVGATTCPGKGVITRTWTAEDNCGNKSTCTQMIDFKDTVAPIISCPADITLECTVAATTNNTGSATATDECSGMKSISFVDTLGTANCTGKQSISRTWTAEDNCGNKSTCTQLIDFKDTVAPVITCPGNITLECNLAATTNNTGTATATDECSGVKAISFVDTLGTANCTGKQAISRTWTAEDNCGNKSTCTQLIDFKDSVAPVITCPANITLECTVAATTNNTGAATATDECSGVKSISFVDTLGTANCTGKRAINRAWTAEDNCGNKSTCMQVIDFKDTVAPTISCPANITLECSVAATTNNTGSATATDECSGVKSITFVDALGSANCTGKQAITRTWTAEDNCGNKSSCTQLIDFRDTMAPVITCPANITLECTVAATTNNTGAATATDDCSGIKSITFVDTLGTANCTGKRAISRTWTAEDNCGNKGTCTQLIDFKDTVAPIISCPANITLECTVAATTNNTGSATATDECSGVKSITFGDTLGSANCTGKPAITRTWTAEDNCGNKSSCTQLIDFKDTVAPIISCPANITLECTAAATTNNTGLATATDECSGVKSISFVDTLGTANCTGKRAISRAWTAEDNCGNKSTCTQLIDFKDTVAPVISCPANITLECTVAATTNNTGSVTATDECSGVKSITFVDTQGTANCTGKRAISRAWTAEDNCGNKSTCTQLIDFKDTVAPIVSCPANITLECNMAATTNNTGTATATDECSGVKSITFVDTLGTANCTGKRAISRAWTAEDNCGNKSTCTQLIDFKDTVAPVISCPANITLECTVAATTNNTGAASATDECSGVKSITFVDTLGAANCTGRPAITRTWTAEDNCGNKSSCTQLIAFKDTMAPVISCPANITLECTVAATTNNTGSATATDECSGMKSITFVDTLGTANCTGKRAINRTWTAEDNCGNKSTCTQLIDFKDTVAPIITCPANTTLECTVAATTNNTGTASATDECSGVKSISFVDTLGTANCTGKRAISRAWTAEDNCGNKSTCTQIIDFKDSVAPVISCPANMSLVCTMPATTNNTGTATASDACSGIKSVTFVDTLGTANCTGLRAINRTWTAEDNCGNKSSCTQLITFKDDIAPILIGVPADATYQCLPLVPPPPVVTASDNCDSTLVVNFSSVTNGACPIYITNTWSVADDCGNASSASQVVSIIDTQPPLVSKAADQTLDCGASWSFKAPAAIDVCSGTQVRIEVMSTTTNRACGNNYSAACVWRVADMCDNSVMVTQKVAVVDVTGPVITYCPPNKAVACDEALTFGEPTATDACGGTNVTKRIVIQSDLSMNGQGAAVYTRCWEFVDACGNVSPRCCQSLTVENCAIEFCSLTQGAWGNAGGKFNGISRLDLIRTLLTVPGTSMSEDLVLGKLGTRSFTVTRNSAECIIRRLPAGGPAAALPDGLGDAVLNADTCQTLSVPLPLDKKGVKFRNVLLGQVITLSLNTRLDAKLLILPLTNALSGNLICTVGALPGPDGKLGTPDDQLNIKVLESGSPSSFALPLSVLQTLAADPTLGGMNVSGLLALGNRALAGLPTGAATLDDINNACDAINSGFDECQFAVPCR